MNVNGLNATLAAFDYNAHAASSSVNAARTPAQSEQTKAAQQTEKTSQSSQSAQSSAQRNREAAVYTPSTERAAPNRALVEQLKAENDSRMQGLVQQMLGLQNGALSQAGGIRNAGIAGSNISAISGLNRLNGVNNGGDAIWNALRTGNFTVDADTRAQAQRDVAEDGYWGAEQTSDRLLKYATALTGNDPKQLDTMISAVKKGFAAAEKSWGGELPGLSKDTYNAVMDKFENLRAQYQQDTQTQRIDKIA